MLDDMVAAIDNRSAQGIAAAIGRLVSGGEIPVGTRLPIGRDGAPGLGLSGWVPIGWPCASRHRAWSSRARRRNAVVTGSPGTRSAGSQQPAASSSSRLGSTTAIAGPYDRF